jgi:hypothetical protein
MCWNQRLACSRSCRFTRLNPGLLSNFARRLRTGYERISPEVIPPSPGEILAHVGSASISARLCETRHDGLSDYPAGTPAKATAVREAKIQTGMMMRYRSIPRVNAAQSRSSGKPPGSLVNDAAHDVAGVGQIVNHSDGFSHRHIRHVIVTGPRCRLNLC